jgi:hypothetical protein
MTADIKLKVGTWNLGWTSEATFIQKSLATRNVIVKGVAGKLSESNVQLCAIVECSFASKPVSLMQAVKDMLGAVWDFSFSPNMSPDGKKESICWIYRTDIVEFEHNYNTASISTGGRGFAIAGFKLRAIADTGIAVFGVHLKANTLLSDVAARISQATDLDAIVSEIFGHKNIVVLGDFNEDMSEIGHSAGAVLQPIGDLGGLNEHVTDIEPTVPTMLDDGGEDDEDEEGEDDHDDDDEDEDGEGTFWASLGDWWARGPGEYVCTEMIPALSAHQNTKLLDSEPGCLDNILVPADGLACLDPDVPGTVHIPTAGALIADHRLVTCGVLLTAGDRVPLYVEDSLDHALLRTEVFAECNLSERIDRTEEKKTRAAEKRVAAAAKRKRKGETMEPPEG